MTDKDMEPEDYHCPTCGDGQLPRSITICPECDAEWPEDD